MKNIDEKIFHPKNPYEYAIKTAVYCFNFTALRVAGSRVLWRPISIKNNTVVGDN